MAGQGWTVHHLAGLVDPERQVARRGDLRVLLSQRSGGGVTGVSEGRLASLGAESVQGIEGGYAQVHLTTHLQHRWDTVAERPGHVGNGGHVGGDILADPTVTPGGRLYQYPVFVAQ